MFFLAIKGQIRRERGSWNFPSTHDGLQLASFSPLFKKLNRKSRVPIEGVTEADDELGNNFAHARSFLWEYMVRARRNFVPEEIKIHSKYKSFF